MKSTAIKQRYRKNLFFVVFCLIVLVLNSMSKLFTIDVSLHVSFLLRLYRCICVCKRTIGSLFFNVLVCYSLLFSSEIINNNCFSIIVLIIIIRLRLGEYCRIIVKYYLISKKFLVHYNIITEYHLI